MQTDTPAQLQAIATLYGHKMLVDPSHVIDRDAMHKGAYAPPSINLLRDILSVQRCRTVLDIGANIGKHSLAFSQLCARLLAFEPSEQAFEILKRNISENNLRNIRALNFGLSNTDHSADAGAGAETNTHIVASTNADADAGANADRTPSITAVEQANPVDAVSASSQTTEAPRLKTGDAYLKSQQINDVDFIKVGAQGHEQSVFEGLKTTLRHCRPLVLVEWNDKDANRSWIMNKEITQSLFPNYQVFALIWNSNKHYWTSKPFGSLRRNLVRIFARKHKMLAKFDPVGHQTQVNDLLLVPTEKLPCVSQYVYR
jgi:FkbM family methyltransferase